MQYHLDERRRARGVCKVVYTAQGTRPRRRARVEMDYAEGERMTRSILMVQATVKRTGAIRKFNGREWVSAGYFMDMVHNNRLDPNSYTLEYKRVEVK